MAWTLQQEAAMTIRDKTLLVSAAAGSGKTSVLTERIIRSLLDEENPADLSRMLIVTFTRAAAAELKERISKALNNAIAENPENERLSKQLFLLGSAQISTIDSFFQKAVKANFEKLGIPATFRIADNSEMLSLKRDLMERLLEEFYQKNAPAEKDLPALSRISQNRFAMALDHLISARSDGKLCDVLLDFYNAFSNDPQGISRLKTCAEELLADAEKPLFSTAWGTRVLERLEAPLHAHLKLLQSTADYLEEDDYIKKRFGVPILSDLALCKTLTDALSQRDHEAASAVVNNATAYARLPGGKIQNTAESLAYKANRDRFKKDFDVAKKLLCHDPQSLSEQFSESAATFRTLYEFLSEFQRQLWAEKETRNAFEFNDIRTLLYGLLNGADGEPTPYAKELATQYDIIYIDEYQDVDGIQNTIFSHIGENHRFMVGDIKQSIYGFRGGEPSIFSGYRAALPLHDPEQPQKTADALGVCVFMSANFRCNEPVIRFTNKVCAFLFSACKESIDYRPEDDLEFKKKMPDELPAGHPAPVRVEVFDGKPRRNGSEEDDDEGDDLGSDETRWVALEIARLLREEWLEGAHDKSSGSNTPERLIPSDIAIITRSHKQNKRFVDVLTALGIPVATAAQNDMLHDPTLIATLNLLSAIDNPYRDLPLMEFLISELGGFTLSQITEIRDSCDKNAALYDALRSSAKQGNPRAESILDWLEGLRDIAAAQSADKLLRHLYADERLAPHASSAPLLFLYDQARLCQKSTFCGLYEFLSHLSKVLKEEKISTGGFTRAECAVQIMTVHHSKGLEFPVVFYAGTGAKFNQEDLKKTLLYHRSLGVATKLYDREVGRLKETLPHTLVKDRIRLEQTEEEIRSLYVALTRARERLYVTGTLRGKYETACKNAQSVTYGDRNAILDVTSALSWIIAALQDNKENVPFLLTPHTYGSIEISTSPDGEPQSTESAPPVASPLGVKYAQIAKRQETFDYPDAHLAGLPSKLAASGLRHDLLDASEDTEEEETNYASSDDGRTPPSFDEIMEESEQPSATDLGTALHTFLEFCDFAALKKEGYRAECDRLTACGALTEATRKMLKESHLEALCNSDLTELALKATECRREQKFSILLPMSELTEDAERAKILAHERVFVQGSIDLLLTMPDGRRILVDYKTDRLSRAEFAAPVLLEQRFREKHGDQLACYARAIRQLFGRFPDEVRIYSVPLGATVRIDLGDAFKN